jgi:[ribosomal protein S5]-alanine N-acetyltransferase
VSGSRDVSSGAAGSPAVRLVPLPPEAMSALVAGDLAAAGAHAGVPLTDYLASPDCTWLWRLRLDQLAADPDSASWVARAGVDVRTGAVVGHAGFHGPPDAAGMVEVGYSVDPLWRRRGYARALLRELLRRAAEEPGVRTVRATIGPDNAASLATIAGFGFTHVGEQVDEVDGLELVFERPA